MVEVCVKELLGGWWYVDPPRFVQRVVEHQLVLVGGDNSLFQGLCVGKTHDCAGVLLQVSEHSTTTLQVVLG